MPEQELVDIGSLCGDGAKALQDPVEITDPRVWERAVREVHRNKCASCGGEDRLQAQLIVSTGKKSVENGVLLGRACSLAARGREAPSEDRRPVNLLVSRSLHERLLSGQHGFTSVSAFVRHLMTCFAEDSSRYDDVGLYQDCGSEIKVNVWIDTKLYESFKKAVNAAGLTVTDAVKGLVLMHEAEIQPHIARRV